MKVKANTRLVHNGQHVEAGKVIDLTEEQVLALGEDVTVIPEQGKRVQAPPPPPAPPNGQNEQTNSDPAKTEEPKETK